MKRVKLNIQPHVIVGDDVDAYEVERLVVQALMKVEGVETVVCTTHDQDPARMGVCRVGSHPFAVPDLFPPGKPVPPLCPAHAYTSAIEEAVEEHRPLFEEVARLTGMKGHIWQSGGMTMTIVFGNEEMGPAYLGLKEGDDEDHGWYGSVGWYPDQETLEGGESADVVMAGDTPLPPAAWAAAICRHFDTLPSDVQERLHQVSS